MSMSLKRQLTSLDFLQVMALCDGAECLQGIQAAKHREKGTPKARFCQIFSVIPKNETLGQLTMIKYDIRNSVVLIIVFIIIIHDIHIYI